MSIREKVARAIAEARTPVGRELSGDDLAHAIAYHGVEATAAITAFLEAAAEQGWHMRPNEATGKMAESILPHTWAFESATRESRQLYRTFIAAAPKFEWDK